MTILYFVIALGVLVFIHEFGHFIVAKKQGIGVEKFSLGFGPRLFSTTRGETTYMVSALPLGGYVKLHGEDPDSPEGKDTQDQRSYAARPIWQRVPVVFAGPAMNLLLALVLMPIVFMLGRYEPVFLDQKPIVIGVRADSPAQSILKKGDEIFEIGGEKVATWKQALDFILLHGNETVSLSYRREGAVRQTEVTLAESPQTHAGTLGVEPGYFIGNEPVIDAISPGSPAESGGLKSGDEILQINQVPIQSWTDMSEQVEASAGQKLAIRVRRVGEMVTVFVVPAYDESMKRWLMGVRKDMENKDEAFARKQYGFTEALVRGTQENVKLSGLTFSVLGRLVTFQLSYKTLGGPIRIAQASAMAAKSGLSDFLYFLCFLSLQLGLLNLLPLPVLDGGHLFFFGIEAVRRKPVSTRIRGIADQVGFVALLSLMLLVTLNDVDSVWGFHKIFDFFRNIFM